MMCNEVKQLTNSCSFSVKADKKCSIKPVERFPAPSLVGKKADEMLEKLMEILNDDGIIRVAL